MSAVFERSSPWQRVLRVFTGFDGPLALAIALLCGAGLITMYSAGYDHGTRFVDHGRNMLLAAGILFLVAQVSPQRMMSIAVPLYTVDVALLIATAIFGNAWRDAADVVLSDAEAMAAGTIRMSEQQVDALERAGKAFRGFGTSVLAVGASALSDAWRGLRPRGDPRRPRRRSSAECLRWSSRGRARDCDCRRRRRSSADR